VPQFQQEGLKEVPDECKTPYDFHKLFLPDEFVNEMVRVSNKYAMRKGREDMLTKNTITNDSLRVTMAIMYLSGYLSPSNRRMFWELREDTNNSFVANAMSKKTFDEIIQHTYFVERQIPDKNDSFWKVRPLFDHLNKTAKQYVQHPERVSVDEGMVKYFGPHPLKQFIRGKPIRFGYKLWIMATPAGELLAVQPYAGATTHIPDFGLGQGPNVVMGLSLQYGLKPGTKICIDNLFTSMDLLDHMGEKGYGVTGTLRQNRIFGIPLPNKKDANKMKRGEMKAVYTEDAVVAVWKDNQPVYMASNCDGVEPLTTCKRFNRAEKGYTSVPQPKLNSDYNTNMGGVDLFDNGTKNYAIIIRLKKWYWCMYTWFLSACMVQAWRLFRAHMKQRHRLQWEAEKREKEEKEKAKAEREKQRAEKKKKKAEKEKEGDEEDEDKEEEDEEEEEDEDEEGEDKEEEKPATPAEKKERKKQLEKEMKKRRIAERNLEQMPLLEFIRQVVELTIKRHSQSDAPPQQSVPPSLSSSGLEAIRYDNGKHLVRLTKLRGVCKLCHKRTQYRCERCAVALHPEQCFYKFHVK
jgi:Transposase IS4